MNGRAARFVQANAEPDVGELFSGLDARSPETSYDLSCQAVADKSEPPIQRHDRRLLYGVLVIAIRHRLAVDTHKLDCSFIRDIHASSDARVIIETLVRLGQRPGKRTVTGHVETKAHFASARTMMRSAIRPSRACSRRTRKNFFCLRQNILACRRECAP
ncbi:EAL domain-containing protein [Burkholderia stagnalis]|uniref:EAL domain-containing protein n=1 Tax=Burkholderia stagnalis TaxID=1503054 RepID=A0A6L3N3C2_9BURK|nr:EAL domain-containing protein [Burkholderia stagnalis]RQQ57945.1 EAL domain-containing protein [Burkholderia stagnalis]RQQ67789.1 EAL domain-containing protein [Burkholderia stagnalis]RQQ68815.1 EAL domain-containing protein [Burkholderia stagnalis]RQQ79925.1 EAL domain-containing protein [Burkholderia stagnalis]